MTNRINQDVYYTIWNLQLNIRLYRIESDHLTHKISFAKVQLFNRILCETLQTIQMHTLIICVNENLEENTTIEWCGANERKWGLFGAMPCFAMFSQFNAHNIKCSLPNLVIAHN